MKSIGDTSRLTHYFGQPIGNGQDPDDPKDKTAKRTGEGMKLAGQGSISGGSKLTPQRLQTTTGGGTRGSRITNGSSKPKSAQRLRG